MQEVDRKEELLSKLLESKEKQLLNEILNAHGVIPGESTVAHFEMGFKLGARFAIEMTNEDIEIFLKSSI